MKKTFIRLIMAVVLSIGLGSVARADLGHIGDLGPRPPLAEFISYLGVPITLPACYLSYINCELIYYGMDYNGIWGDLWDKQACDYWLSEEGYYNCHASFYYSGVSVEDRSDIAEKVKKFLQIK